MLSQRWTVVLGKVKRLPKSKRRTHVLCSGEPPQQLFRFPGGETLGEVQKRAGTFFDRAVSDYQGINLVMVSHAATLTALVAHVLEWNLADTWREGRAIHANTAFSKLELDNQTGVVTTFELARTDHLI